MGGTSTKRAVTPEDELIEWLGEVADDPFAFVMGAFPWGEPGTSLEHDRGPENWQREILESVRVGLPIDRAIQLAVASGHGVGKSALVSWLILWAISTFTDCRGVITANTETQLKTKTWAELGKWYHLFIGKDLFKLTATALFQPERERTWRIDMVPWSERNTEAFAGMHNKGRRILMLFDEASAIPDIIWETAEGALSDKGTQIIWCVFGNPTRNTGRFRECFSGGQFSSMWRCKQVDSREVSFTNKEDIERKISVYGADSDYIKIRVLGQFPARGEMEFFNADDIDAAMHREVTSSPYDPVALGVDVARYGTNNSVLYFRKGRDGRSIPRERYNGIDTVALSGKVMKAFEHYRCDGIFIDGGGVGGGVVDQCRHHHLHVWDIQFGAKPDYNFVTGNDGERYANKRAEMYGAARAWLKTGAIPNDPDLRQQMLSITYTYNKKDQIQLISKEDLMRDGKDSPDDLDGFVLTFAQPLASHVNAGSDWPKKAAVESEYDPIAFFEKEMQVREVA